MNNTLTDEVKPPPKRNMIKSVLTLLLGVALFVIFIALSDFEQVLATTRFDFLSLLLVFAANGLMMFVFAARWSVIINAMITDHVVSPLRCYYYSLSSLAAGQVFAGMASVITVRTGALNRVERISLQKSAASVLIDKTFDLFYALLFAVPAILFALKLINLEQTALCVLVVFIIATLLIIWKYRMWMQTIQFAIRGGLAVIKRIPFLKIIGQSKQAEKLLSINDWQLFQRKTVLYAYVLTGIGELLLILRSWAVIQAVGIEASPLVVFLGVVLAQMSLLVAVTPGGLGMVEAAWYFVLINAGITPGEIGVFLVAHRVVQTVVIGLVWLIMYLINHLRPQPQQN